MKDKEGSPIFVLLTAPFPALRQGLKSLLESDKTVLVTQECASPNEWGSHLLDIEVILVAPIGPVSEEWIRKISKKAQGKPFLLFLSQTLAEVPDLGRMIWGALPLSATKQEMVLAIQALANGLWILSPAAVPSIIKPAQSIVSDEDYPPIEQLTEREIEVLQCLAQGFTNKEIAGQLGISSQTVKFHLSSIFSKLGVTNRTEAVSAGVRRGWVTL